MTTTRTIGVQVDGKTVGTVDVPEGATEGQATRAALMKPEVRDRLGDALNIAVVLYKVDRIIGFGR